MLHSSQCERKNVDVRTPEDVKAARAKLGMTLNQLAHALRMSPKNGERTIRRWEDGDYPVPGPAQIALETLVKEHAGA